MYVFFSLAHYAQYFIEVPDSNPDEPEIVFDRDALKFACKSFLDSIIIELSFPEAPYSKRILYQILHEAVDEAPREAKRFPQELWDAVGDLSVCLFNMYSPIGVCVTDIWARVVLFF